MLETDRLIAQSRQCEIQLRQANTEIENLNGQRETLLDERSGLVKASGRGAAASVLRSQGSYRHGMPDKLPPRIAEIDGAIAAIDASVKEKRDYHASLVWEFDDIQEKLTGRRHRKIGGGKW